MFYRSLKLILFQVSEDSKKTTHPSWHICAFEFSADHVLLVFQKANGCIDPLIFPPAVVFPHGPHQHAQNNPADAESKRAGQVYGIAQDKRSHHEHQELHDQLSDILCTESLWISSRDGGHLTLTGCSTHCESGA